MYANHCSFSASPISVQPNIHLALYNTTPLRNSKRSARIMVNSSPEYAMYATLSPIFWMRGIILILRRTKPGVRPLSRKRDKPLRTYGRQPTATPEPRSEPQAKRARTAYSVHEDKNVKPLGISASEDAAPVSPPPFKPQVQAAANEDKENQPSSKPEPSVPAKRSILNYFKPVTTHLTPVKPAVKNALPAAQPVKEETQPVEEEPLQKTSPPQSRPKRRLLRIRSNQSINSTEEPCSAEENEEEKDEVEKEPPRLRKRRLGGSSSVAEPRRIKRKTASAEVQTTLNISNQAAFSECKICDTVWNPLYPDDVKYHTKRHASHLRAKKKREEDF